MLMQKKLPLFSVDDAELCKKYVTKLEAQGEWESRKYAHAHFPLVYPLCFPVFLAASFTVWCQIIAMLVILYQSIQIRLPCLYSQSVEQGDVSAEEERPRCGDC